MHDHLKMVTVNKDDPSSPALKAESLAHIDMAKLSQSELHSLSLYSDAAFDPRRTEDIVYPPIDRKIFNESSASSRQTYSRSRATAVGRRRGLLPNPRASSAPAPKDPVHAESRSIVNFIKQLVSGHHVKGSPTDQLLVPLPQPVVSGNVEVGPAPVHPCAQSVVALGDKKGKRERKPKAKVPDNGGKTELEIVNKDGVVVDFRALVENGDDLFATELRRRTVGLETETEVLEFLSHLEGQWGSRRKKRKIVDASELGNSLPLGWKLLLGLKRREGRVSINCRRFISPNGQQFLSCKEVSSYLQSYFGLKDPSQALDEPTEDIWQHAGLIDRPDTGRQDTISNSTSPSSTMPNLNETEFSITGIDNLPEVQIQDLFECYKCNMAFHEKSEYLNHILSLHQKTVRRYEFGLSVGEGVIIKDKGGEELPGQHAIEEIAKLPSNYGFAPSISRMDALVEVAQSSILEPFGDQPNDNLNDGSSLNKLDEVTIPESHAANSGCEVILSSDPTQQKIEDCTSKSTPDKSFDEVDGKNTMIDEEMENDNSTSHSQTNIDVTPDHPRHYEVENPENVEQEIGFSCSHLIPSHVMERETSGETVKGDVLQDQVAKSSNYFPSFDVISSQGGDEVTMVNQKFDSVNVFDELRLDDIEPLKFSFFNTQESPSLPDMSINIANEVTEVGSKSLIGGDLQSLILSTAGKRQFRTVCIWCGIEFNHEVDNNGTQSDSVGFICPPCKTKISGQFNVLDNSPSIIR
ncbi:hypothetical protein NMG60_11022026 [Bertholletia excelsa]